MRGVSFIAHFFYELLSHEQIVHKIYVQKFGWKECAEIGPLQNSAPTQLLIRTTFHFLKFRNFDVLDFDPFVANIFNPTSYLFLLVVLYICFVQKTKNQKSPLDCKIKRRQIWVRMFNKALHLN